MAAKATLQGIPILLGNALGRIVIDIVSGVLLEGKAFDGYPSQACKWSSGTFLSVRICICSPTQFE